MINQQSNSQIQKQQVSFHGQQIIHQILKIKYQDEHVDNRAFKSLQCFIQLPYSSSTTKNISLSAPYINAQYCLNINQVKNAVQKYYSMSGIVNNIKTVIQERLSNDSFQAFSLFFIDNPKLMYFQSQKFEVGKRKAKKNRQKLSIGSQTTSKNSDPKKNVVRKIRAVDHISQSSSLMLQRIGHDLSRMIQERYRNRQKLNSFSLKLSSKLMIREWKNPHKISFKWIEGNDISNIYPPSISGSQNNHQLKSILQYYGPKSQKRPNHKSKSKRISSNGKISGKSSNNIYLLSQKKADIKRTKMTQMNSPCSFRNSDSHYNPLMTPMTPTPRYQIPHKQLKHHFSDKKQSVEKASSRKSKLNNRKSRQKITCGKGNWQKRGANKGKGK